MQTTNWSVLECGGTIGAWSCAGETARNAARGVWTFCLCTNGAKSRNTNSAKSYSPAQRGDEFGGRASAGGTNSAKSHSPAQRGDEFGGRASAGGTNGAKSYSPAQRAGNPQVKQKRPEGSRYLCAQHTTMPPFQTLSLTFGASRKCSAYTFHARPFPSHAIPKRRRGRLCSRAAALHNY